VKSESGWVEDFEIFLEQVESLQSLLVAQALEAQELAQDLVEANQEIQSLNQELIALPPKPLCFIQALVVTKKISMAEKPSSEWLAQLLSALYKVEVTAQQLEED
jgi:hypothetical protein